MEGLISVIVISVIVYLLSNKKKPGNVTANTGMPAPQQKPQGPATFAPEGYFSYETPVAETPASGKKASKKSKKARKNYQEYPVEMSTTAPVEEIQEVVAEDSAAQEQQGFDLRQAILYQTILNNKFIPEIQ